MREMLLGLLPWDVFLERYWGRAFYRSSSQALLGMKLFGLQDFVEILAFLRPCEGRIRLVQDGNEEWKGDFRQEQVFALVTHALSQAMTVCLERLDLFWPPVIKLCGMLATELSCPVHANAYLTPAGALGLRPHYDTHDVFVLQLEGEKDWSLGQIEYLLPTERISDGVVAEMHAQRQLRVHPGDVLYVPRGMAHSAQSAANYSLHLTISCIPYTYGDEIRDLMDSAARQIPALRSSIAPSMEPAAMRRAQIASLISQVARLVETGAPQPLHRPRTSQTQGCYRFEDAFEQFRASLDIAGISSVSTFSLNQPEDIVLVREGNEAWVLRGGTRSMLVEEELLPVMRSIITMSGAFSFRDLPSEWNQQHAIRAIVRLLRSSFLRMLHEPMKDGIAEQG